MRGACTGSRARNTPPAWAGGQYWVVFIPHSMPFFHTVSESGGQPAPASLSASPATPAAPGPASPDPIPAGTSAGGFDVSSPGASPGAHDIYNSLFSQSQERPGLCVHPDGTTTLPHRYLLHNVYQGLQTTSSAKPLLKFAQ